ncbi:immunoglobulin-like domain-containing protein [Pseudomonas sp. NGC7]|uniref:immunoglobulin-like domain-containing protein n=1 Tax=Pseudomonas sp. NGC7 TaxID=3341775 RepID=UPI00399C99C4
MVKVTITADQVSVAENVKPTFTVHINTALAHDLVVTLSNNATVTIKAGETSAPYTHEAQGDDVYKDAGEIELGVKSAADSGAITYTITLTNKDGLPIDKHSALTFTLSDGTTVITVPANSTSGFTTVAAPDNVYVGTNDAVIKSIASPTPSP